MRTKKILHIIGGLDMNGAETFLMNIYRKIDRNKYSFYFLCYGDKKYDYENEIQELGGVIIRINKPKPYFDFYQIKQIKKIIKQNGIDVVHAHTYYNSMYAVIAARLTKRKTIIVHSHSTHTVKEVGLLKKLYAIVAKMIINRYSTCRIACGNEAGKALFNNNYVILNNAVDLKKFKYSEVRRIKARAEFNIDTNDIIIGHVGRFHEVKNQSMLLDVLTMLDNKYKLLLVGDGPLLQTIKEKTKQMGLNNRVFFAGKRDEVYKIYNAFDIYAMPSLYEGIPVAIIEAQANGLNIIASDNIDRESNIEKHISFLPISNTKIWKKTIMETTTKRHKVVTLDSSLYNINNLVKTVEKIYNN